MHRPVPHADPGPPPEGLHLCGRALASQECGVALLLPEQAQGLHVLQRSQWQEAGGGPLRRLHVRMGEEAQSTSLSILVFSVI